MENYQRKYVYEMIIMMIIGASFIGCGTLGFSNKSESAEEDNQWDQAVAYYEKAAKNHLFKSNTKKLAHQAREHSAYYHYREALYAVEHRKNFLQDQEKALAHIQKSLTYKPDEKDYVSIRDTITKTIETLKLKMEADLEKTNESIGNNDYLEAYNRCEAVLYMDSKNDKAMKIKNKIMESGSEYYLQTALEHENKTAFNSAIRLLQYSIELKESIEARTAIARVTKKKDAEDVFNAIRAKINKGDYRSTLNDLRKMVALDNKNPAYRQLLLKGLTQRIMECMDHHENQSALETILEIKSMGENNNSFKKALNGIEEKLVKKIMTNAEKDLKDNLPGNALEALVWLDQRQLLDERGKELLEKTMTCVRLKAIPSIGLFPFSGNSKEHQATGFQLTGNLIKMINKSSTVKCRAFQEDDTQSDYQSDILLDIEEPVSDISRYVGQLNGTSLRLKGIIDSLSFRHVIDKTEKEKSYISHYEKKVNPEYIIYQNTEQKGLDMPETKNKGLSALFTAVEIASAIVAMIPPPKYIETPVYATHKYTVEDHTVDTVIDFSLFLIDKHSGRILMKKNLSEKLNLKDSVVPGNAQAGIDQDKLELSADSEIIKTLLESAAQKALIEIESVTGKLQDICIIKAKKEKERGRTRMAREYSVMAAALKSPLSTIAYEFRTFRKSDVNFIESQDQKVMVKESGPESSPLEKGDVVIKINGTDIMNPEHAIRLLCDREPGSLVKVEIERVSKKRETMLILNPVYSENHMDWL